MRADRFTLAQIATSSLAAARVLEGHDIDYCSGAHKTLEEACEQLGLNVASVSRELTAAQDESLDDRDWTTEPLGQLVQFLIDEHVAIRSDLAALQARLERLANISGGLGPNLQHLPRVFAALCDDLRVHMGHEEVDVFPAIRRYLEAADKGLPLKGSPLSAFGGPLRMMETEHETNGTALRLMREFAHDYSVPSDACPAYEMLIRGMAALEDRLLRHVYLENNVLFPRAAALKSSRASTPA